MGTWSIPLDKLGAKAGADIDGLVRKVTIDLFTRVIVRSPVDTGRFKGNWQASLTAAIETPIERIDKEGDAVIDAMIDAVMALVRRGVTTLRAKRAIEVVMGSGRVLVQVPLVESSETLRLNSRKQQRRCNNSAQQRHRNNSVQRQHSNSGERPTDPQQRRDLLLRLPPLPRHLRRRAILLQSLTTKSLSEEFLR